MVLDFDYSLTRVWETDHCKVMVDGELKVAIKADPGGFINLDDYEVLDLCKKLKEAKTYCVFLRANLKGLAEKAQNNIGPLPLTEAEKDLKEHREGKTPNVPLHSVT